MNETESSNTGQIVIAIISLILILVIAEGNFTLVYEPIKQLFMGNGSFSKTTETITANYKSDALWLKNESLTINGLFARVTGRRVYNEVTLLKNGMLTSNSMTTIENVDMQKSADKLIELSNYLDKSGIPFLYVQAPDKVATDENLLPAGTHNSDNAKVDSLLNYLGREKVNYLDLRKHLARNGADLEKFFYRTDHHWRPEGAFVAFELVFQEIERLLGKEFDGRTTEIDNWEKHEKDNWFLGSRGKRVGPLYAGTDSLIWYTPIMKFNMSCSVPSQERLSAGSFEDACIGENYINTRNLFGMNNYSVYRLGDYPIVKLRNLDAKNKLKVLLVSDSFALPFKAFLSTAFTEVEGIDLRHYKASNIVQYIRWNRPDLVIVMYSSMHIDNDIMLDFGPYTVQSNVEKENVLTYQSIKVSSHNQYTNRALDNTLVAGYTYNLAIDSVEIVEGTTRGFSAVLYEKKKHKVIWSEIFDILFTEQQGERYNWTFMVPNDGAKDAEYMLLLYCGVRGHTKGNTMIFHNVQVDRLVEQ